MLSCQKARSRRCCGRFGRKKTFSADKTAFGRKLEYLIAKTGLPAGKAVSRRKRGRTTGKIALTDGEASYRQKKSRLAGKMISQSLVYLVDDAAR